MALEQIFRIMRDVLVMNEDVKRLDAKVEKLAEALDDVDRRVVRLETMVEMAQRQGLSPRQT